MAAFDISCCSGTHRPSNRRGTARSASLTTLLSSRTEVGRDIAFSALHLLLCIGRQAIPQCMLILIRQSCVLLVGKTINEGRLRPLLDRAAKPRQHLRHGLSYSLPKSLLIQQDNAPLPSQHHNGGAGLDATLLENLRWQADAASGVHGNRLQSHPFLASSDPIVPDRPGARNSAALSPLVKPRS